MKNTKDTKDTKATDNTTEKLLNELKALVSEAEKLISGSTSDSSMGDGIHLSERCEAATQKASEIYDDTKKQTAKAAKCTNTFIHKNPYASIAIAAASGILTGLLVGHCGSCKKDPS